MKMLKKAALVALVISGQYLNATDVEYARELGEDIHRIYKNRRLVTSQEQVGELNDMAKLLEDFSNLIASHLRDDVEKSEYIEIVQQAIDESIAMVDWINSQDKYVLNPSNPTQLEAAKKRVEKARFELIKTLHGEPRKVYKKLYLPYKNK